MLPVLRDEVMCDVDYDADDCEVCSEDGPPEETEFVHDLGYYFLLALFLPI